jgi:DNA-binding NtrC family response regulator
MKNLLLIDDNKQVLESLSAYLSFFLRDCTIRTAENGRKALDIIRSEPIDVILTDLEMPVMDGFELVAYAKVHYPAIPVLVMTGRHSQETENRAKQIGASEYIIKPFDTDAIRNLITARLAAVPLIISPEL